MPQINKSESPNKMQILIKYLLGRNEGKYDYVVLIMVLGIVSISATTIVGVIRFSITQY